MTQQHEHTDQFIETLRSADGAVSADQFVEKTGVEDRDEAKEVLRSMIEHGMVSTTPEWEYRLASNQK